MKHSIKLFMSACLVVVCIGAVAQNGTNPIGTPNSNQNPGNINGTMQQDQPGTIQNNQTATIRQNTTGTIQQNQPATIQQNQPATLQNNQPDNNIHLDQPGTIQNNHGGIIQPSTTGTESIQQTPSGTIKKDQSGTMPNTGTSQHNPSQTPETKTQKSFLQKNNDASDTHMYVDSSGTIHTTHNKNKIKNNNALSPADSTRK